MAAPALSTPFQPYVYQNAEAAVTAFQIFGVESQIVQIMLRPQDNILAKSGSMCYMSGSIQADLNIPVVPENAGAYILQWLVGKSDTTTTYTNKGTADGFVAFAAPSLARILPIELAKFGGEIICQRDAFLCSVHDVTIKPMPAIRAKVGYFGGDAFFTQKLVGQGLAFITAAGSIVQKKLDSGEIMVADTSCVVAMTSSVTCEIKHSGSTRRAFFGGESPFQAHLTGPGIVFIQSLPSQRLARSLSAPQFRDNPRFIVQAALFVFLAYAMIISSLLLAEP